MIAARKKFELSATFIDAFSNTVEYYGLHLTPHLHLTSDRRSGFVLHVVTRGQTLDAEDFSRLASICRKVSTPG